MRLFRFIAGVMVLLGITIMLGTLTGIFLGVEGDAADIIRAVWQVGGLLIGLLGSLALGMSFVIAERKVNS